MPTTILGASEFDIDSFLACYSSFPLHQHLGKIQLVRNNFLRKWVSISHLNFMSFKTKTQQLWIPNRHGFDRELQMEVMDNEHHKICFSLDTQDSTSISTFDIWWGCLWVNWS